MCEGTWKDRAAAAYAGLVFTEVLSFHISEKD